MVPTIDSITVYLEGRYESVEPKKKRLCCINQLMTQKMVAAMSDAQPSDISPHYTRCLSSPKNVIDFSPRKLWPIGAHVDP
jgi:hypothetical protein